MDSSPPGTSVQGILQKRMLAWVAVPASRGSLRPRDQTQVPHTAGRFFTGSEPPRKPAMLQYTVYSTPVQNLNKNQRHPFWGQGRLRLRIQSRSLLLVASCWTLHHSLGPGGLLLGPFTLWTSGLPSSWPVPPATLLFSSASPSSSILWSSSHHHHLLRASAIIHSSGNLTLYPSSSQIVFSDKNSLNSW